jgi:hypothetical protein
MDTTRRFANKMKGEKKAKKYQITASEENAK